MPIPYLENLKWSHWSREERFYCAALYQHAQLDPCNFVDWVNEEGCLGLNTGGDWDIGYEVCFYRDFLWHRGRSVNDADAGGPFPPKRTFDLCLFGERAVVIVEAKVFEGFDLSQNADFDRDRALIKRLEPMRDVDVKVVALASSAYIDNVRKYGQKSPDGKPKALSCFDGNPLTWRSAFQRFKDSIFQRADELYSSKAGQILGNQPLAAEQ